MKDQYREMYREGFLAGYNQAYRGSGSRRSGFDFPWPF